MTAPRLSAEIRSFLRKTVPRLSCHETRTRWELTSTCRDST